MAEITFACSSCGMLLKASDQHVGQTVACPQCSTHLTVPAPSAQPSAAPPPPASSAPAPSQPFYPQPPAPAPQSPPSTCGWAIASLVLGLLPCTCVPSLLAIIFGHMAVSKIDASNGQLTGRGMAIAGLVLGYVFMVANLIYGVICGFQAAQGAK